MIFAAGASGRKKIVSGKVEILLAIIKFGVILASVLREI